MIDTPEPYEPFFTNWWNKNIQTLIDGEEL